MLSGNLLVFLIGGALIGVPIVLHLLMQQKPKHLIFPALRFLKERRETNQRKLNLRHFILLLLRCLVILAIAAALARPATANSQYGAWVTFAGVAFSGLIIALILTAVIWVSRPLNKVIVGVLAALLVVHLVGGGILLAKNLREGSGLRIGDEKAPVAAVLIIDTSPRMELRQANQTRLEAAVEIADWVLGELPADSRVSVIETGDSAAFFSVDLSAARKRMETFEVSYATEDLPKSIESAISLVQEVELQQKEVYVLTDLTRRSWGNGSTERLRQMLERQADIGLYIVDVGDESPENLSLGDLKLRSESITRNGEIQIQGELQAVGGGGSRTVEFHLEKPDLRRPVRQGDTTLVPEETVARQETVEFETNGRVPFRFQLSGVDPGVHHGWIEIQGQDGLAFDDRRYFTVEVRGQWKTLVVSPDDVNPTNITQLLSPLAFRQSGQAMFDCQIISQDQMSSESFDDYSAIFLLDPTPISEAGWNRLGDYVSAGGGLFVMLGHHAEVDGRADPSFNTDAAQRVLPGELSDIWRGAAGDVFISPNDFSHEIMAPFRQGRTTIPWATFPVYRHWGLRASASEDEGIVRVVTRYSNRNPALVEKQLGEGRVLTLTTPYTDPARPEGRRRWNDLPLGECWPTWLLIKQASEYLVQARDARLNYNIGDQAFLANDGDDFPDEYRMFTPDLREEPRRIQAVDDQIRFRFTDRPGAYRLKGTRDGVVLRGFSVNALLEESDLKRLSREELVEILGSDRFQLARSQDEILREQGVMRSGQEFYSLLIVFLVLILALEHLLANRFYGNRSSASSLTVARQGVGTQI